MKNQFSSVKQLASVAITAGILCFGSSANGQESTTYAPDPPDRAGDESKVTAAEDTAPKPSKVGSMAPVGQKPSKAELEKQKAAGGGTPTTTKPAAGGTGTGALADTDRQFLMMAAKDGMKEVHMGQMAAQQGQSAEVKKLGQQIAADHTKANQQLMAIAAKKGIKPDTGHKMEKMSKKDMANFDQAWIGMMINDHQKDIAAFQRQAQNGTDPDLKNFAKKTLPVLQKHLKMVQQAQQKMGSGGTAPNTTGTGERTGATTAKSGR